MTNQSSTWTSPFDQALTAAGTEPPAITTPEPVIGTPDHDARDWAGQQHYSDDCAIRCQEYLITQFTGHDPGEAALVQDAADHGWYHPGGGTSVVDVGNLLEEHGIAVNRYQHASVFHLANELAQGHKVIVGVHADDLWHQHPILDEITDKLGLSHADHAVVVSGIDTSDPLHPQVVISDPGTGQAAAHYPMDQFLHAWKDSDFFMVATQEPPPPSTHLPEMVNFDYDKGHIDQVLGHSYEDFIALGANPAGWEELVGRLGSAFGLHLPLEPPSLPHEPSYEPSHPSDHPSPEPDSGHHPDLSHDPGWDDAHHLSQDHGVASELPEARDQERTLGDWVWYDGHWISF